MVQAFPDGIDESHLKEPDGPVGRVRWFALVLLATILLVAMLGTFGGWENPKITDRGEAGSLTIEAPETLRNGEFFELHLTGAAHRAIAKPTLAVSSSYWRDLTINTMIPAPASEAYEDGFFLFEFDPLDAGKSIDLKIDGQVNPPMFAGTEGAVEWRDGDAVLARLPVRLKVFP